MGHGSLHGWVTTAWLCDVPASKGAVKQCYLSLKGAEESSTENNSSCYFCRRQAGLPDAFTGSKNIDACRIYRIFKIAKYIQLSCGRALYSLLSQNFKF